MSRKLLRFAICVAGTALIPLPAAYGQNQLPGRPGPMPMRGPYQNVPGNPNQSYTQNPRLVQPTSAPHTHHGHVMHGPMSSPAVPTPPGVGYPYLNAPMYPSPVPGVPYQVGGTMVTNQAFAPHEMLYAHKYKALYPPYYYKVGGHWVTTPFGVWSAEDWDLQGTEVEVKYKSKIGFFTGFHAPFSP